MLTPEQALAHLDEAASKFNGTRQDHQVLMASVAALSDALLELRRLQEAFEAPTALVHDDVVTLDPVVVPED